jgi:hypothetical protein
MNKLTFSQRSELLLKTYPAETIAVLFFVFIIGLLIGVLITT